MEKLKHFANHNVSNCTRRHSNPNVSVSKIFVLSTKTIMSLCTYVGYREEKGMVEGRSLRLFIFNLESLHSGKKKNHTNRESPSANLGGCLTTIGQTEELDLVYTSRLLP